ncbi:aspartyl-phosphate phosphatase Spo0E family protein [Hazenella coriacea]|uniref:Spo0E like sporulation regulatory protein n=1 Tax=Hazenella coriacea TaxID=1179467 RepID=A0A4V2UUR4_9BACL|nr:aspartyl-phosphate phosphatase Spo0E family protein [Hazenella coriacea]TCS92558.1 Spo0E like sporulation regulatory protein [Hazenella coriacea]
MVTTSQSLQLEKELERLRLELYQSVNGELSRLTDARVLPVSQELDDIIVQVQREKQRHC